MSTKRILQCSKTHGHGPIIWCGPGCEVRLRANFLPGELAFGLRAERMPVTVTGGELREKLANAENICQWINVDCLFSNMLYLDCTSTVSIHSPTRGLEWPVAGAAPAKIVRDWGVEFASWQKGLDNSGNLTFDRRSLRNFLRTEMCRRIVGQSQRMRFNNTSGTWIAVAVRYVPSKDLGMNWASISWGQAAKQRRWWWWRRGGWGWRWGVSQTSLVQGRCFDVWPFWQSSKTLKWT